MRAVTKNSLILIGLAWLTCLTLFPVPIIQACQICVPYPEETLADGILEKEQIIFAREAADSPYVFYPVEVVKGEAVTESFKMFCDSTTRRKLKAIAGSAVFLARDKNESWRMVAFAEPEFQSFLRTLVIQGENWADPANYQERLHFFSNLLNSTDERIKEQAYIEVGRAPYTMIKGLAKEVSRDQIYGLLGNYRLIEWHNLYILMLGQSREQADIEFIRDKFHSAARFGSSLNLAAWTTAYIESHPDSGVEEIERIYFMSKNRSDDEIEQVVMSMSVLGSQTQDAPLDLKMFRLRSRIVQSYAALLRNYPEMVGLVVKDLTAWQVHAHTDLIAAIRKKNESLDPATVHAVEYYLSAVSGFRKNN